MAGWVLTYGAFPVTASMVAGWCSELAGLCCIRIVWKSLQSHFLHSPSGLCTACLRCIPLLCFPDFHARTSRQAAGHQSVSHAGAKVLARRHTPSEILRG